MEILDYDSKSLWRAHGDHGNLWVPGRAEVFVEEGSQVQIGFRATAGDGTKGAIGLDDISLRQGHCPVKGTINSLKLMVTEISLIIWSIYLSSVYYIFIVNS